MALRLSQYATFVHAKYFKLFRILRDEILLSIILFSELQQVNKNNDFQLHALNKGHIEGCVLCFHQWSTACSHYYNIGLVHGLVFLCQYSSC